MANHTWIRLRWSKGVQKDPSYPTEATPGAGLWFSYNRENKERLETAKEYGEKYFGEGTYWIESRQT
jgi:hypothetical protein